MELSWLPFVLLALAAFRLTRLVTTDVLTEPLRQRVWARFPADDTVFPDDGTISQNPDQPAYGQTSKGIDVFWSDDDEAWLAMSPTKIGYLIGCDFCASIWVSGLVAVAATIAFGWVWWWAVLLWWGLSGAVSVIVTKA